MWSGLVELVYPPRCVGCGESGALFCASCQRGLVPLAPPLCARCGGSRASTGPPPDASSCCLACLRHPPGFEAARSVAVYEGPIRAAIQALKYRRRRALAEPLGGLLATQGAGDPALRATCVVPVPLHPSRLAARGFNQADLLARPVAVRLGLPCVPDALRRIRQESPQAESDAVSRRTNVLRAFAPGPARPWGTVLLVDDVFSTGSTVSACADVLLEAGASRVVVLTLARAVLRCLSQAAREGCPRKGPRPRERQG